MLDKDGHFTLLCFDPHTHKPVLKAKRGYEKEKDAVLEAMRINIKPQSFRRIVAYKCKVCGKWHLGHNKSLLDDTDKEKIKKKYNMMIY